MTPAFLILLFLGLIFLWFLLSSLYRPIGTFIKRVIKDSFDEINKEDNE